MNVSSKGENLTMNEIDKRSREIRIWMLKNNVRQKKIASNLNINQSAVSHWVKGEISSKRIKQHFLDLGCPQKLMER